MVKTNFDEFIEMIPKSIHSNTKSYVSKNIAIFIPEEFVIKRKIKTIDYHFVIFHTTPPTINIENTEFQYKKGSFICIEPGIEIEVDPINSLGDVKFISICINKGFFERIASQIIDKEKIGFQNIDNAYSHQLLDIIKLLISEIMNFGENCPLMIEGLEAQLIIQLLRDCLPNSLIHRKKNFTDNDYIDQSIRYMQEYYSSNITINEICSMIYVSSCHFQRVFKKQMKQTPYNYLMGVRVDKAKERLIDGQDSIGEVARQCGFVSTAHFSSVFKKIEGVSPSEYRKSNLEFNI